MQKLIHKTFVITLVSALTLSLLYAIYNSSVIFLSALIGIGLSALITPYINKLNEEFKVPRFLAAVSLLIMIMVIFSIIFFFLGSIIYEQFSALNENLPDIIKNWKARWIELTDSYPAVSAMLKEQSSKSDFTGPILAYFTIAAKSLVSAATGVTLAVVIAIFTSVNAKNYYSAFLEAISEKHRENYKKRLMLSQKVLHSWFGAQLIDMVAVALLTGLAMWVTGIKYWALFGLTTGVLVLIPFVGILLSVAFSACIIVVVQPEKFFILLLIYGITQLIEGNLLLPMIMKDRVKIPAAPLIFLMAFSGIWFGILGVLVTTPLFAISLAQYRFNHGEN